MHSLSLSFARRSLAAAGLCFALSIIPVSAQTAAPARASATTSFLITSQLRGLVFLASPTQANDPLPAGFTGVDATRVPLLRALDARAAFGEFLDAPVSRPTLDRIADRVRAWLRGRGENFVLAYAPPQDVTDGVVRMVVARARLDGDVVVEGAKYFSAAQYRAAVPLAAGADVDSALLAAGVDRLNQNPFRRVTSELQPGREPGTTRLALRVEEQFPLRFDASFDNTGSPATGEDRIGAGLTWGDAFWRGDRASYRYTTDPDFEHMKAHAGDYTTVLPWGHLLTLSGSWSHIESLMPEPLTQQGTSWQIGGRYVVPLRTPRANWTQSLAFTADFKYSDNNLEFAAIPITNNVTHIAQLGATYGLTFPALGGQNSAALSGYVSPGGLTRYNKDRAFGGPRPGARAEYAYGSLTLSHRRGLTAGWSWISSATAQLASGALLGTEQMAGTGAYAVRGYRENTAFGDSGVIVNNELHAPDFALLENRAHLAFFGFVDFASLNLRVEHESTDLRSAGLGLNLQWSRFFAVRAAYGWQMKRLDGSDEHGRGHVSANVSF